MAGKKTINIGRLVSPLRYPGSKRRLIGYVKDSLLLNNMKPKLYVESFAGGGSIVLQLLAEDLVEKAVLIDLDPLIAGFWKAVFFDSDWLIEEISRMEVNIENWHKYKSLAPRTIREFALKCFFLNRTSFSGILQAGAGPIGGLNQVSEYTIDCRFPKKTLIRRIERISAYRNKIHGIWNCSWREGIAKVIEKQGQGKLPKIDTFLYFDPPFFHKADRLYKFFFSQKDHEELRDYLLALDMLWMLSYDSAKEVESLYKNAIAKSVNGTRKEKVEILYSIANTPGSRISDEIVLSNLPELPSGKKLWNKEVRSVSSQTKSAVSPPVVAQI